MYFAKPLGHNTFKASNGWLNKLKKRNNIVFPKICGESACVKKDTSGEWQIKLPTLIENYEPNNVFNADETALFYQWSLKLRIAMEVNTARNMS